MLQVQARLTDRDHTLLAWLADHQVLTTPQIDRALLGSARFEAIHAAGLTAHIFTATQQRLRDDGPAGLVWMAPGLVSPLLTLINTS